MAPQTNEQKALNALKKGLDVHEFAPKAFAYGLTRWTPRMQKRFWDICFEFMLWIEAGFQRGEYGDADYNSMQLQIHEILENMRG